MRHVLTPQRRLATAVRAAGAFVCVGRCHEDSASGRLRSAGRVSGSAGARCVVAKWAVPLCAAPHVAGPSRHRA